MTPYSPPLLLKSKPKLDKVLQQSQTKMQNSEKNWIYLSLTLQIANCFPFFKKSSQDEGTLDSCERWEDMKDSLKNDPDYSPANADEDLSCLQYRGPLETAVPQFVRSQNGIEMDVKIANSILIDLAKTRVIPHPVILTSSTVRAAIARCGKTHVSRLQGKEVLGKLLYYFIIIIQTMTWDCDIVHDTFLIEQLKRDAFQLSS